MPQAGLTNAAIFLYDQTCPEPGRRDGLLDVLCQTLNNQQVEYLVLSPVEGIDLASWGFIQPGFRGSAVISATAWEHPMFDLAGQLKVNPVGLAGVIIERGPTELFDTPGDDSAGSVAFPLTALGN